MTAPVSTFDLEKDKCGYCLRCGAASKFEQFRPNEEATPLDELTFVEEMSISIELPLMYLSTLSPGGQLGYKAHTTVVPQDVGALAKTLPWGQEKLKNHLCIIRQGGVSGSAGQGGAKNCRDFQWDAQRVRRALEWLIKNNPYYANIAIDESALAEYCEYFYGTEVAGPEPETEDNAAAGPSAGPAESVSYAMRNGGFVISATLEDGNCFFDSIRKAMERDDAGVTVQSLRTFLRGAADRDGFLQYKGLYENAKAEFSAAQEAYRKEAARNTAKKRSMDARQARKARMGSRRTAWENAVDILAQFDFMEGVKSLSAFKNKIGATRGDRLYWADSWAIEKIQLHLNIKCIVIRRGEGIVIETKPEGLAEFRPGGFVVLDYNGAHYQLYQRSTDGRGLLQFADLPPEVRRGVRGKEGFFSLLPDEMVAEPPPADTPPPAPHGATAAPATKLSLGVERDGASPPALDRGDGDHSQDDQRKKEFRDVDTASGIVEGAEDATEVEKLKKVMQESAALAAKDSESDMVFDWPRQGAILDKRQNYGTFAKAFPKLFPREMAMSRAPSCAAPWVSKSGVSTCSGTGVDDSPSIPAFGSTSSTGSTGKSPPKSAPSSSRRTTTGSRPPRT